MSYIFVVVGILNFALQSSSRNIMYFYVFVVCIICGFILLFAETKNEKIASLFSILSFVLLSAISLYYHFLYGCVINDYLIIMVETIIISMLTAISILPIKAKTSRRKKREVLPYMEQGGL